MLWPAPPPVSWACSWKIENNARIPRLGCATVGRGHDRADAPKRCTVSVVFYLGNIRYLIGGVMTPPYGDVRFLDGAKP